MLSLVADYSSDSADESPEEQSQAQSQEPKEITKLPSANKLFESSASGKPGEVFSNPYKQAEKAKIALLEHHVKMVNSDEHQKMKNGKKICWNYRKGRCRFGSNCSFAHDSDLNVTPSSVGEQNIETSKNSGKHQLYGAVQPPPTSDNNLDLPGDDSFTISAKKRNRPGLSESIVPSKRVLKSYSNQKQNSSSSFNRNTQRKLT